MPTPTGLPKAGEVWELTRYGSCRVQRVVVLARSRGDYWSLTVARRARPDAPFTRDLWVDASYHLAQGWLRYIGPAGPATREKLTKQGLLAS